MAQRDDIKELIGDDMDRQGVQLVCSIRPDTSGPGCLVDTGAL